jgi:hypothetical protein
MATFKRTSGRQFVHSRARISRLLQRLRTMTAILLLSVVGSTSVTIAQTPPQYLATPLSFRPRDINEEGVVVGGYQPARLFAAGLAQDLNDLGAYWLDLDTGLETTDWAASEAFGINENNQIVGTASHIAGLEAERVFVLNDPLGPQPSFVLLPRFGNNWNRGRAINDLGVVVGYDGGQVLVFDPLATPPYAPAVIPAATEPMEINNAGVIVTRNWTLGEGGYVISPAGTNPDGSYNYSGADVDFIAEHEFYGINDSGMISGFRYRTGGGHGRNATPLRNGGPLRFTYLEYGDRPAENDDALLLVDDFGESYFCDVNEFGDVAFTAGASRAYVYLEGYPDPFELDQLVVFNAPEDEALWLGENHTQANGINDQGQIIIRGVGTDGVHFLLTPVAPDPGITVTTEGALITSEAGDSDQFTVQLNTLPGGNVTIGVTSLDPSEGITNVNSLSFDDNNWNIPQVVVVTGVQDSEQDGDQSYEIELAVTTAPAGSDYEIVDAVQVSVTNQDDELPMVVEYSKVENPPKMIPDNFPGGVSSLIPNVADHDGALITVTLSVDHPRLSDLEAWVTVNGAQVPVNASGVTDISGMIGNTQGDWTLTVRDLRNRKEGFLLGWTITTEE